MKNKIGMYGETKRIKIGVFDICEMQEPANDSIWVENTKTGEGSEFKKSSFELCVREYFEMNM